MEQKQNMTVERFQMDDHPNPLSENDTRENERMLNQDLLDKSYKELFNEINIICGENSTVSKCSDLKGEIYAVKKVPLKFEEEGKVNKELDILRTLESDFVVSIKSSWIENNYMDFEDYMKDDVSSDHPVFDPRNTLLLHIQMEYCFKTLKDVIEQIIEFKDKNKDLLSPIGYYIASKLSIELLECVHFIHKMDPPIIHRDLKPANILITNGNNGRFIKLADFGLSTIHEYSLQSHTQSCGTLKFMAPEVVNGRNYNTKADIFSLGVIMQNLFNINTVRLVIENM
jgi:serine/threonine protein kinase